MVQAEAIPKVLAGRNVVVVAPTASGKTEAVVAPVAELTSQSKTTGLKVLYITPTRALVNDTEVRLKEPLEDMGLKLAVQTGDRRQFRPQAPPDFLVTTPESLDSMICRYPQAFSSIEAVVLDELHLIDGTYRGDQLRILLRRLRGLSDDFRCHALSATIASPVAMAERYFEAPEPVVVPGGRRLRWTIVENLETAIGMALKERASKLLVFVNSRRMAEELASRVKESLPGEGALYVEVHHGSLARHKREEVEEFLRQAKFAVCVATTTLEVGIDIGDIDTVILAEPPPSVSTLLQRVGRGNRRSDTVRAIAVCNGIESLVVEAMFKAAERGCLEATEYAPDLSVVVQQLFSMLFARPDGLFRDEMVQVFDGFCPEHIVHLILRHLVRQGLVVECRSKWFASDKVIEMGDRGKIHTNIPDHGTLTVRDMRSGEKIGEIQGPVDNVFALGGRAWKVVSLRGWEVYVRPLPRGALPATFTPHRSQGAFARYLPDALKQQSSEE